MKWLWGAVMAVLIMLPAGAAAQEPPPEEDPFEDVFFAPEYIMMHRRAIDLTDEQRDAITRSIQDLQGQAISYQFELLEKQQDLIEVLSAERIDLDRAMDRTEQFLETENRVKRAQLELLIRIKNVLRPEQQRILMRIREEERGRGPEG